MISAGRRPPGLRVNVVANFLGRASSILLAILFTPVYIRLLGMEAYGLIGFHLTLQGAMGFLEMGLSRACNRELARCSGLEDGGDSRMRDTLRTLELVYWGVAALLGLIFGLASHWVATRWLTSSSYSPEQLANIVSIMGWVVALRWPAGLYYGALMGMQHHVWVSLAQAGTALVSGGGAVLALWLVRPDIMLFFQWQVVASVFSIPLVAGLAWRFLPGTFRQGRFSLSLLTELFRFAGGVGLNAVMGTILRQADKLILSAVLPLKLFGYYTLASLIANATSSLLAMPVSNAVFPRFSQLVAAEPSPRNLPDLYHTATQLVAVLVVPVAMLMAFFAHQVVFVYTGSRAVADGTALTLTILAVAKMLHASMVIPYALQLAYGWLRLSLYLNVVSVLWLVPAVYLLSASYGPAGAATAWLIVTIGYLVVGTPLMHRRLLVGEWRRWMLHALAGPVLVSGCLLAVARWGLPDMLPRGRWSIGFSLFALWTGTFLLTAVTTPGVRRLIVDYLGRLRSG